MKTVLVVDDEQGLALSVELVLSDRYRVLKASTGEEALLLSRDCRPDLILMDIMMPGLSGLEALRILKSHPELKKIPVILMSAARPLVRQADFGWAAFLAKPFSLDQLLKVVNEHI